MRVLTVSEPGLDGVFRHVEALVPWLLDRGVDVDLAWSSRRHSPDLFELVRTVREGGGETIDLAVGPGPGPRDALAMARLVLLVSRRRPDLIHSHSSKAGGLVRLLSPLVPDIPVLHTPHAYFGMDGRRDLKARIFHAIESWLGSTGETIHVSKDEQAFGVSRFGLDPARCHLAGHGVDPSRFAPAGAERRRLLRERFGLPQDAVVVGTLGRMGPQKDYPTLYRALAPLLGEGRLLLQVGRGPDSAAIGALARDLGIEDRIVAIDFLDRTEEFYGAVDLVVMTSTYEAGIPYVALETLACGLPLVATRCPGLRELADEPFDAIRWAPTGDAGAVGQQIARALAALGEPNDHRATIEARFTLDRARQRVLEIYSSTLGRHGKGTVTLLS